MSVYLCQTTRLNNPEDSRLHVRSGLTFKWEVWLNVNFDWDFGILYETCLRLWTVSTEEWYEDEESLVKRSRRNFKGWVLWFCHRIALENIARCGVAVLWVEMYKNGPSMRTNTCFYYDPCTPVISRLYSECTVGVRRNWSKIYVYTGWFEVNKEAVKSNFLSF